MGWPVVPPPDDELALLQYLRTVTILTVLVPAVRITTELPPSPVYPVLLLQRAGGIMAVPYGIDEAAIQVDAVGGSKQLCKQIMLTARAAILAIANDMMPAGVLVSAIEEVGPSWFPDTVPVPPIPRYTARFRILTHN